MAPKQTPLVHPKKPATGAGVVQQTPGKSIGGQSGKTGMGPSNHNPAVGK